MFKIQKIWNYIVNFSIEEDKLPFEQIKKVRILNGTMIAVCFTTFFYLLFLFITKANTPLPILLGNLNLFFLSLIVYLFHYFHLYYWARYVIVFAMTINMSMVALNKLYNTAHSTEHYMFVIAASCFFLFDRLRYIIPAYFFVFICYVIIIYNFGIRYPQAFVVDGAMYFRISIAFFLLFLILNFFRQEHENHQRSIELQNDLLTNQNEEISQQRDNIISSINYAKRIQTALLPTKQNLQTHLPNLMLLYLPKDIVSGDFYWFSQNAGKTFLAVADCTGHGVPGAFMTVIGESLLDQIINKDKIFAPAQILTELDIRLRKTLQQQGLENEKVNDGMDIALLQIDLPNRKIVWAGAKRPLWIFEANKNTLNEYKSDKFPIGSTQFEDKTFTEQVIVLEKGDTLYAFTDGFADQFGAKGKLTVRRLREFLEQIQTFPFEEQEQLLAEKLHIWRGEEPQTDDVLMVGLKF